MRLIAILAALLLAAPALAQQSVMPVPLVGTGAGLDSAPTQSGNSGVAATGAASFYGASITLTTSNTAQLVYLVPPGHYVRLVSTVAGTGTTAIVSQVELTLG